MTGFAHILAKSDLGGLIVFLLVIAFWALSAFSNWIKKQQEAIQRNRLRQMGNAAPPPMTPTRGMPPVPVQNLPRAKPPWRPPAQAQRKAPQAPARVQMPPRQPQPQARRTPARPRQSAGRVAPPPIPGVAPAAGLATGLAMGPATKQDIAATEIRSAAPTSPSATRALAANAGTLNRWLRPATMRQQFILTELLQPPLALRERSHLG